jgi:hypothetical protein
LFSLEPDSDPAKKVRQACFERVPDMLRERPGNTLQATDLASTLGGFEDRIGRIGDIFRYCGSRGDSALNADKDAAHKPAKVQRWPK